MVSFHFNSFLQLSAPPEKLESDSRLSTIQSHIVELLFDLSLFCVVWRRLHCEVFLRTEMLQTKKHLSFFFCESLLFWLLADFFSQARGKSYYHTNTPLDPKTMKHVGSKALKI